MASIWLQRLVVRDFRGFSDLTIGFERDLTVLVGANGAGKTSLVDAIVLALGRSKSLPDDPVPPSRPSDIRVGAESASVQAVAEGTALWTRTHERPPPIQVEMTGRERMPDAFVYRVNRQVTDHTPGTTEPGNWSRRHARLKWYDASAGYQQFFHWFKEMEDLENEQIRYEGAQANPQLDVVRQAIKALLPEFTDMRVRRHVPALAAQPVLVLRKGDVELPFDALSEGERTTIAMVGDLARRLVLLAQCERPLESAVTVVIDEIEEHAHPGWQRQLLTRLRATFPNAQFIVTTHSPIVVSEVEPRALRVLQDFQLAPTAHGAGRDANAVLEDVFGVSPRKREVQEALDALAEAVDEDAHDCADELLARLEALVSSGDPEVVYYRNLLARLRELS